MQSLTHLQTVLKIKHCSKDVKREGEGGRECEVQVANGENVGGEC